VIVEIEYKFSNLHTSRGETEDQQVGRHQCAADASIWQSKEGRSHMFDEVVSLVQHATISLSALEFSVALAILAFALVLRYNRVGLVAGYIFTYKWGWTVFAGHSSQFLLAYLIFGGLVGVLSVIGMLHSRSGA